MKGQCGEAFLMSRKSIMTLHWFIMGRMKQIYRKMNSRYGSEDDEQILQKIQANSMNLLSVIYGIFISQPIQTA